MLNRFVRSPEAPNDFDIQVPYFLPKRISVQAQDFCRPNLVAARCIQGLFYQRLFNLFQHAVVQTGRRQAMSVSGKEGAKMLINS